MKKSANIIKNLLLEISITRNNVLTAIKNQTPVVVQKPFLYKDSEGITSENVIMTDIDEDDIITGNTETGEEIQFSINDILSSLNEGIDITNADTNTIKKINAAQGNKGISMNSEKLGNMDTAKVGELIKKTDDAGVDINLTEEIQELKTEINLEQQQSEENLINWCNENQIESSSKKQQGKNINYTIFINNSPIETYIYENGDLKIGGHKVKDKNTFNRIIAFYKDNK